MQPRDFDEWDIQRAEALQEARDLLKTEYHSSVAVGTPSEDSGCQHTFPKFCQGCLKPFVFPPSHITTITQNFIKIIQRLLASAFSKQEEEIRARMEAVQTARMMLELWNSVVGRVHAKVIKQVPRVAALYRNDALYIAYNIEMFPFQFPVQE